MRRKAARLGFPEVSETKARFFIFGTNLVRTELQSALDLAASLDPAELPELLGDLEQVRAVALARLVTPTVTASDSLIDVTECAARMHTSKDWLYRNSHKLKFARRIGRKLLFSSNGLDGYLKKSR